MRRKAGEMEERGEHKNRRNVYQYLNVSAFSGWFSLQLCSLCPVCTLLEVKQHLTPHPGEPPPHVSQSTHPLHLKQSKHINQNIVIVSLLLLKLFLTHFPLELTCTILPLTHPDSSTMMPSAFSHHTIICLPERFRWCLHSLWTISLHQKSGLQIYNPVC